MSDSGKEQMNYVESNLVPGETVIYQTRLHWIVMLWHIVLVCLLLGLPGVLLLYYALSQTGIESKTGRAGLPSHFTKSRILWNFAARCSNRLRSCAKETQRRVGRIDSPESGAHKVRIPNPR